MLCVVASALALKGYLARKGPAMPFPRRRLLKSETAAVVSSVTPGMILGGSSLVVNFGLQHYVCMYVGVFLVATAVRILQCVSCFVFCLIKRVCARVCLYSPRAWSTFPGVWPADSTRWKRTYSARDCSTSRASASCAFRRCVSVYVCLH